MPQTHLHAPQAIDADDDDTDICPVCDGQCTCQKPQPSLPSLKLKLSVPHGLLKKHRLVSSTSPVRTTSDSAIRAYLPKKRGRPPKSNPAPSRSTLDHKSRPPSRGPTKFKQNVKARAILAKRVRQKRKKVSSSRKYEPDHDNDVSSVSSPTDVDMDRSYPPSHFPTFVSASALDSLRSSSDSDSRSDDGSSLLRHNPRDREREKARIRRELLGDDPLRRKLGHPINNEWIIRSRKTSVDLTEADGDDMDVDSDSEEEQSDDGLQQDDAEDEDDEPDAAPVLPFLESQDSETTDSFHPHHKQQPSRRHYVRLGKAGWSFSSSEDEESAFDADLFFRYLYDSSSSPSSSSSVYGEEEEVSTEGQDIDDEPLSAPFLSPPKVESLPFELAESWDGGVVFTNGEGTGSGDATAGFVEVDRLGRGFGYRGRGDSDAEMDMRMGTSVGGCASCLEDGYLEEDGECEGDDVFSFNDDECSFEEGYSEDEVEEEEGESGSGDTTDEDLVGSDSLPNERAMRLFKLPLPVWGSVSAVDPLSLVSSRPRRELEMMEVVEDVAEKRRRGKGKNKGKGRMRRETRDKAGRERRKEGKKRREPLPSPFDILEGRGPFWDMDDDEEESSRLSSSSGSFHRDHEIPRSPRTPTPTPARSPTTPVPTTPALSIATSFTTGPRKGVFVVPPVVSEWIESRKRKGKAGQKATVIIGEDRKGEDVPSPHPRRRSVNGRGDGGVVEQLLRRHLVETLGAGSNATIGSDATATVKASPPTTPRLGVPFSPLADDVFSSSSSLKVIQLADVLDAEFLKDDDKEDDGGDEDSGSKEVHEEQEVKGGLDASDEAEVIKSTESVTTSTTPTPALLPGDVDLAADAAAVKNLSRWDVVSVGAFRQTLQEGGRESAHVGIAVGHGHVRTPGASTDYGNAMKRSGKFALGVLWRGSGSSPSAKGTKAPPSSPSAASVPGAMRRSASGGMIGSKQAKKQRLMMNSSSTSVMKQPLVLPATSVGAAGGSNAASSSSTAAAAPYINATVNTNANKTRKEARRERKLQKRNASQPYGPRPHSLHPHSHHQHHQQHIYHAHPHHPNAKTRGVGSAQRLGGWFVGGGSGGSGGGGSGGSGAGTWSGGSGFGGGFGGLGF